MFLVFNVFGVVFCYVFVIVCCLSFGFSLLFMLCFEASGCVCDVRVNV